MVSSLRMLKAEAEHVVWGCICFRNFIDNIMAFSEK